jgi:hypothetical protein
MDESSRGRGPATASKPIAPQSRSGTPSVPGLKRNDTSFAVKSTAKLRELYRKYVAAKSSGDKWANLLKYYQYLVRAVMTDPEYGIGAEGNARGLLIYHAMGMGKTRLAVAIAMSMWDVRQPVVMLARGLQKNFLATVAEVVAMQNPGIVGDELVRLQTEAQKRFAFVSMDAYNSADQMARVGTGAKTVKRGDLVGATGGLDNKLLIVDEAHNFFRAIVNSSAEDANARRVYDMIMTARNLRIAFFTGSPAAKTPFEFVPAFNMLAGYDLLPTQYEIFCKLYVDRENNCVRNREKLANRLVGLVSHVSHKRPSAPQGDDNAEGKKDRDDGWFPEELPRIIERVEMSPDQYRQYLLAREKEDAEGKGGEGAAGRGSSGVMSTPPLALPGSEKKAMRSYFVKSRSLSTFSPPREWIGTPIAAMPDDAFSAVTAPKLELIADRTVKARGPVLIYSQFVDASGLQPMGRFLRRRGYKPLVVTLLAPKKRGGAADDDANRVDDGSASHEHSPDDDIVVDEAATATVLAEAAAEAAEAAAKSESKDDVAGYYAIISGEVDHKIRDAIKDLFNSTANIRGAVIKAILVSKTGAEGLDLKYIVETHQIEPYWDMARDDQVRARAVRIGCLDALPREERYVQNYLYIATANRVIQERMLPRDREAESIDEQFHTRAVKQFKINESFRDVIAEVCLECEIFGYSACRVCVPTNVPLFHDDAALDVRLPDPCECRNEADVTATPVQLRDITYYYVVDPSSPLGYTFYIFREDLDGYAAVDPADNVVLELLDIIRESKPATD